MGHDSFLILLFYFFSLFIKKCSSHLKLKQNKSTDGTLVSSPHFMEFTLPKVMGDLKDGDPLGS